MGKGYFCITKQHVFHNIIFLRWHPDKFKQKIGPRIRLEDMDSVMAKVKTIAQALTSYAK